MKDGGALAYTLWHWPRAAVVQEGYEQRLTAFHQALTVRPAVGFRSSHSSRVARLPWANGGGGAYQDRFLLDDWATVARLEAHAISDAMQQPHSAVAASMGGGIAGVYGVRLGSPPLLPTHALWFAKPEGMSDGQLDEHLGPVLSRAGVLWIRRLVLGPTPEFCLETQAAVELPPSFRALAVEMAPVWAGGESE